jgi:hypothetical protein
MIDIFTDNSELPVGVSPRAYLKRWEKLKGLSRAAKICDLENYYG